MIQKSNSLQSNILNQGQKEERDIQEEPLTDEQNPNKVIASLVKRGYTLIAALTVLEDRIEQTVEVRIRLMKNPK